MTKIVGTSKNDTLKGTSQDDTISGLGGNDWLWGNDGNDMLLGGRGNDSLDGGRGNDTLDGDDGNDTLLGGRDNDLLDGDDGNDSLMGGDGNDTLTGESGNDILDGGRGNDNLSGGNDRDTILGGRDNDLLDGGRGNDSLNGGDDRDTLLGGTGNDMLEGGRGNDSLDGGRENDTVIGGMGSDTIAGGDGNDVLVGDGGARLFGLSDRNSLVSFDPDRPDRVTTTQISGIQGNLVGIDFRPANGLLYGVTDANSVYIIDPNSGRSQLVSNNPTPFMLNGKAFGVDFNPVPDRIRVVSDADQNLRLNPDTGGLARNPDGTNAIDTNLAYAAGDANAGQDPNIVSAAYTNNFAGSTTTTLFDIDSNLDTLVRQGGANVPPGTPSPNTGQLFTVGSLGIDFKSGGFDIFSPAPGINDVNLAYAVTDSTLYSIDLSTGAATNLGTVGNGSVNLIGVAATAATNGSGNDIVTGGRGSDTLVGGRGNDTLTGGGGTDSFSFSSPNDRTDTIADFSVADDTILVSAAGFGGGLVRGAAITPDQFVIGAAAVDAGDRFIYNNTNGALSFDVDGAGGAALIGIANLSANLPLTNNDIVVTA
jgi:Ca2+-binding RTX toxin-like protein